MYELRAFDIYTVETGGEPLLIESVIGMAWAKERMVHYAEKTPGPYWVWDNNSHQILYRIDTTPREKITAA